MRNMESSPDSRNRLVLYLFALVYPALLYGAVFFVQGRSKLLRLCLGCLVSIPVLAALLPTPRGVVYLVIPALIFGTSYLMSFRKSGKRPLKRKTPGHDPVPLDGELEEQRIQKRRSERKYKSKWENVRWWSRG